MADNTAFAETVYRIHGGKGHEFIEVCPDADVGGMVEIRMRSDDGKEILHRIPMDPDMAPLVAEALVKCARDLKENPVLG